MPPTRSFTRHCTSLTRGISTSSIRCAKKDKKEKGKAKPVVKKSTRKGEVEPPKKAKLSPESEMKIIIRKATAVSQRNQNKMSMDEAIRVLRAVEVRSPWSAYELLVKTAVMRGRPVPRGQLELPKDPRMHQDVVLYFADEGRAEEALQAGASFAGGADLIPKVLSGEIQPTKVFSTPSLIPVITPKLARFLGPKNLMPSIKKGTVSDDIAGTIKATQGSFAWKGDKMGTIQAVIGRMHFAPEDVIANIKAFMKSVHENSRDPDDALTQRKSKKMNSVSILSVRLSSRQGPGIQLEHV